MLDIEDFCGKKIRKKSKKILKFFLVPKSVLYIFHFFKGAYFSLNPNLRKGKRKASVYIWRKFMQNSSATLERRVSQISKFSRARKNDRRRRTSPYFSAMHIPLRKWSNFRSFSIVCLLYP